MLGVFDLGHKTPGQTSRNRRSGSVHRLKLEEVLEEVDRTDLVVEAGRTAAVAAGVDRIAVAVEADRIDPVAEEVDHTVPAAGVDRTDPAAEQEVDRNLEGRQEGEQTVRLQA